MEPRQGDEADRDPTGHRDEHPPRYPGRRERAEGVSLVILVGPDERQHAHRGHVEVQQGAGHTQEVKVRVVSSADARIEPVVVGPKGGDGGGTGEGGIGVAPRVRLGIGLLILVRPFTVINYALHTVPLPRDTTWVAFEKKSERSLGAAEPRAP